MCGPALVGVVFIARQSVARKLSGFWVTFQTDWPSRPFGREIKSSQTEILNQPGCVWASDALGEPVHCLEFDFGYYRKSNCLTKSVLNQFIPFGMVPDSSIKAKFI